MANALDDLKAVEAEYDAAQAAQAAAAKDGAPLPVHLAASRRVAEASRRFYEALRRADAER